MGSRHGLGHIHIEDPLNFDEGAKAHQIFIEHFTKQIGMSSAPLWEEKGPSGQRGTTQTPGPLNKDLVVEKTMLRGGAPLIGTVRELIDNACNMGHYYRSIICGSKQ